MGLADDVLAPMSRLAHPGYFAFIPASCTFPGALGDLIASALDIDVGSWMSAAGPSQVELLVLSWLRNGSDIRQIRPGSWSAVDQRQI